MIKDSVSKIKSLFQKRKFAYVQTFRNNVFAREVLEDLARFCRANESTFAPDARLSAVLEGRREVWLRIQNHLQLTSDELYDLHQVKVKSE